MAGDVMLMDGELELVFVGVDSGVVEVAEVEAKLEVKLRAMLEFGHWTEADREAVADTLS